MPVKAMMMRSLIPVVLNDAYESIDELGILKIEGTDKQASTDLVAFWNRVNVTMMVQHTEMSAKRLVGSSQCSGLVLSRMSQQR